MMKERLRTLLKEMAALDAVAGFEQPMVAYLKEALAGLADDVSVDRFGNVYATRKGERERPSLMLAAHTDEIGCLVRSVDEQGFLRFEKLGGVVDQVLPGRVVRVAGKTGVVGVRPGHLQTAGSGGTASHTQMYIDVGARSRAEVAEMGIQIGAPISFVSELRELGNPDRLCGKAIDNRIGCAVLLALLEDLKGQPLPATIHAVMTVQEEVGMRGAANAAFKLDPDFAIVVDTIPSGDTPGVDRAAELNVGIGEGVVIPVMSGNMYLGSINHPGMVRFLTSRAEREAIPYQVALFPQSTSDASTIQATRGGIPTGTTNIPRRYAHTPVEVVDLNDAVNVLRLLRVVVEDMEELAGLEFLA